MNFLRIYRTTGRTMCNNTWCPCVEEVLYYLNDNTKYPATIIDAIDKITCRPIYTRECDEQLYYDQTNDIKSAYAVTRR